MARPGLALRAVVAVLVVTAFGAGCKRSKAPTAASPVVAPRSSALTVYSRSGWTASASLHSGDAGNVLDGNLSTGWSNQTNGADQQWFQVDMGTPQTFAEVTLDSGSATNDYARNYELKVSNDGSTWTSATTGTGTSAFITIAFPLQTARYFRVILTASFGSWWAIRELNVYGPQVSPSGWSASGSANASGDLPANAIDGTNSTRWSTSADQTSGQYFQLDMQRKQSFDRITLDAGTSTGKYPRGYEVYVSNDGSTWGSAIASGTGTTEFITITFSYQWARYLKVVQTGSSSGNVWAIHELKVFGSPTGLTALPQVGWSATASPTSQYDLPEEAFDGNAGSTSRWSSGDYQTNGMWFRLDMGAAKIFSQLTLDSTANATDYPRGYEVHVSNDGSTWGSAVASGTNSSAFLTIDFPVQNARYIRITQTGTASNMWSIYELNVLTSSALSRTGWIATGSANSSSNTPPKSIDNSASSRFDTSANQTSDGTQYLQLDMITQHAFNEIWIDAGSSPDNYPRGYSVYVSNDGSSWGSAVATGAGSSRLTTIKFVTQTARYLKVVQTGTASVHWSVYEINVLRGDQPCDAGCTASDTCHDAGSCDPYTGTCSNPAKSNGASCNDANACTTGETCTSGVCGGGSAVTCSGADQCHTVGACVPATGCPSPVAKDNGTSCSDSNACTQNDTCQAGVCTAGAPVTCAAPAKCRYAGTCNPSTGACVYDPHPDWTSCDDGNPCSTRDVCLSGTCTAFTNKICRAQDQCHLPGTCDPSTGNCSQPLANDGTACNDGNACTGASACVAGACTGSSPTTCPPSDLCNNSACDPSTGPTYPKDDLVALWRLDGNIRDSSPSAAHWEDAESTAVKVVAGKRGAAFEFGANEYLSGHVTWFNEVADGAGLTFSAWVKPASATCPGDHIVYQRDWQFSVRLSCASGTVGVQAAINTGSGPFYYWPYTTPAGNLPIGQWSLITVTWDKASSWMRFYVGSTEVYSVQKPGFLVPSGAYTILGGYGATSFYGVIDEAAWYRRALTPTEIAGLMEEPNACKTSPKCSDPDACHSATCSLVTGCGAPVAKANGTSCSDGNSCTQGDVCSNGVCGGAAVQCGAASSMCNEKACDAAWFDPPATEVIGRWALDGSLEDSSGHDRDLTGEGYQTVTGKRGQALHFDASGTAGANRKSMPFEAFTDPSGATLAAWVKPDSTICNYYTYRTVLGRAGELMMRLECLGSSVGVKIWLNWTDFTIVGNLPKAEWSHLILTYDRPAGRLRVYINGQYAGVRTVAPNTELGTGLYGRGSLIEVGSGAAAAIDEALILNRSVDDAEAARIFGSPVQCAERPKTCVPSDTCHTAGTCNSSTGQCSNPERDDGTSCSDGNACTSGDVCQSGACVAGTSYSCPGSTCQPGSCNPSAFPAPPSSNLIGWWRFDGDTRDSSGHGYDLSGSASAAATAKIGGAVDLNGGTCLKIDTPPSAFSLAGASGVTMMAWVKTSASWTCPSASSPRAVMGKGLDYTLGSVCPDSGPPGLTYTIRTLGGDYETFPTRIGAQPTSEWTLIAVTFDHHNVRRYVNGALVDSRPLEGSLANADTVFSIGCIKRYDLPTPSNYYLGSIDEASLYDRPLTEDEIAAYFAAAGQSPCTTGPAANGTSCNDGQACTSGDTCQGGACVGGPMMTCPPPGPCQVAGACDPGTGCPVYVAAPNDTVCDDGNACTQVDRCSAGACVGGSPKTCTASDACHSAGTCDPATGMCSNPTTPGPTCQIGVFDYDGAGRLVRDHAAKLTYDAYDQLVTVEPGPMGSMGPVPFVNLPVTNLGHFPGGNYSNAVDVNLAGDVVGYGYANGVTANRPFIYTGDGTVDYTAGGLVDYIGDGLVDFLGDAAEAAPSGLVQSINEQGVLVGTYRAPDNTSHPFLFTPPNHFVDPGKVGDSTSGSHANASGQLNGSYVVSGVSHAYLYTPGDGFEELPGLGGTNSYTYDLNDLGDVIGSAQTIDSPTDPTDIARNGHAVMWHHLLGLQELDTLVDPVTSAGWELSVPFRIDGDYIVGTGKHNGETRAFRLEMSTGEVLELAMPGIQRSYGLTINAYGDAGGVLYDAGGQQRAWVYSEGRGVFLLNGVIEPDSGWTLLQAQGINNAGDVVGFGQKGGLYTAWRLRLPLHTAGASGPIAKETHTYGYDGLRTSTTTYAGMTPTSQYWFTQDYTETGDGHRHHYLRIGDRVVAKVSFNPEGGAGMLALPRGQRESSDDGGDLVARILLALMTMVGIGMTIAGAVGRKQRPVWVARTAGIAALFFIASCEMLGTSRRSASTLWSRVKVVYFHHGLSPGPVLTTREAGVRDEERRYEPFGQDVDALAGSAYGRANLTSEPLNSLNRLTNPNSGWSYHGARWMHPQSGRWTAPDPAIKSPTSDVLSSPWNLNPYSYAAQSPTLYWDPDGAAPVDIRILEKGRSAVEKGLRNPPVTNVGGAVWARNQFYEVANQKIKATPGAIKTHWFAAATLVTNMRGVRGATLNIPLLGLSAETRDFMLKGNEYLFGFNERNFNNLVHGREIPGLEGLRGADLDNALVVVEQIHLEKFMKRYFTDGAHRARVVAEVNKQFSRTLANGDVSRVISEKLGGKFDFNNVDDRIALGVGLTARFREEPDKIKTCDECK